MRACVPKDAAALRLWGCVSDEISDAETARAAAAAILPTNSDDLFARLAPLLAMKRAPAKFWFLSGADGAFALLKAALMMNEHKAVKTIAAEVLGRLPPSYTARAAQDIFKYVDTPSAETADARELLVSPEFAAELDNAEASGQFAGLNRQLESVASTVFYGVYLGMIGLAVVFQGGLATYYALRRRNVATYLEQVPAWARDTLDEVVR